MTIAEFNNFDKVFSHEGPEYLKTQVGRFPTPMDYVMDSESRLARPHGLLFEVLFEAASLVEPKDPVTGYDSEFQAAHAFTYGAIIGTNLADIFLKHTDRMQMVELGRAVLSSVERTDEDKNRSLHALGSTIVDTSEHGLQLAELYRSLLEDWETDVCPDITKQRYFSRGFGYVVFLIDATKRIKLIRDRSRLERQLDDGVQIDWDAELQKISEEGAD